MVDIELVKKLVKGEQVTDDELATQLFYICDSVHASCDDSCPIYELMGGDVNKDNSRFGCNWFKDGHKMLETLRKEWKE